MHNLDADLQQLADSLGLGLLLQRVRAQGSVVVVDHWQQGEFHHDLVLRADVGMRTGVVLVVATNCNGGVKEVLCFDDVPRRGALWAWRCPDAANIDVELDGASTTLPTLLGSARTLHWFNPCELVADGARSELKASCRRRALGGGWEPA
jgi:hypothetical protein